MASRKNNQETSKQSTLLRWVRPDREPSKTENRGEQAVLEETSQESDEQAAGTSNSSNSNINTTPQGPELPPTPDLPSVSKGPNQPKNFKFPQRTFGNSTKKRSFQPVWFEQRPWLHYVEKTDMVLCFTCVKAIQNKMLSSTKADPQFTRIGYSNWKNAMDKKKGFQKHALSESHKEAVARVITAPATTTGDVGELLSEKHAKEKAINRKILLTILSNVRFLARQALPLRGNWDTDSASEINSNFYQLLKLRSEENPEISEWLSRRTEKYTSPMIQNEMLEVLALGVLREISENIQNAKFFTIMADETADVSIKEQLVVCIRWVDDKFVIHEDFIGMWPLPRTTADQIVGTLREALQQMNLDIQNARGQCYDGAATMAGEKTGVATQIKSVNGKCLYTHCYGHALNLAVADAIKSVKCMSDALDTVREIGKLVKKSPQRNTKLDQIREETTNESRGVHAFCPTRWTVRVEALASVLNNHDELMELWDWSLDVLKDTEMKSRINGVKSMMTKFSFYFGCCLGEKILRQTDNLSRALQSSSISAAQENKLAVDVVKTLKTDRSDESFDLFWGRIKQRKDKEIESIEDPVPPRKRKVPSRFELGQQQTHYFPQTAKDHYKQIYFEAIDFATTAITARFDQKDFKVYMNLQELLLKATAKQPYDAEVAEVLKVYSEDLNPYQLEGQLVLLPQVAASNAFDTSRFNVDDLISFFQSIDEPHKLLLSEICMLGKLLLVIPATNAASERSFSALKRVKTYLRATTGDARLNHLMTLHVHRDRTDSIDLVAAANQFVGEQENRKQLFGSFTTNDLLRKVSLVSRSTQTSL